MLTRIYVSAVFVLLLSMAGSQGFCAEGDQSASHPLVVNAVPDAGSTVSQNGQADLSPQAPLVVAQGTDLSRNATDTGDSAGNKQSLGFSLMTLYDASIGNATIASPLGLSYNLCGDEADKKIICRVQTFATFSGPRESKSVGIGVVLGHKSTYKKWFRILGFVGVKGVNYVDSSISEPLGLVAGLYFGSLLGD